MTQSQTVSSELSRVASGASRREDQSVILQGVYMMYDIILGEILVRTLLQEEGESRLSEGYLDHNPQ